MILSRRFTPAQRRTALVFLAAGVLVSALFLFAVTRFHEDIAHPRITALDRNFLEDLHARDTPTLTRLARFLSFIGSPATSFPLVAVASILLWLRGLKRDAVLLFLAMLGGGTLDLLLKLHFRRIRPDVPWVFVHEHSFSFPSGHSVLAVVLYGILTYLFLQYLPRVWQRIALVTASLLLIAGIGLSRIYLAAHYPSDVAAGYFVGATWLLALIAADWTFRRQEQPVPTP